MYLWFLQPLSATTIETTSLFPVLVNDIFTDTLDRILDEITDEEDQ